MSGIASEMEYKNVVKADAAPQAREQPTETDELSMGDLDDVNGGLAPLLFLGGYLIGRGIRSVMREGW